MERRPSFLLSSTSLTLEQNDPSQGRVGQNGGSLERLSQEGSRLICMQKTLFLAVLLIVGVLATVFISLSTSHREEAVFVTTFDALAVKLTDNFLTLLETKVLTSFSIALSMTSDALYYNKTWPNSLMPNFDQRLKANREITETDTILFAPLVTDANRASWEAFVMANQDQVAVLPDENPLCGSDCRTLQDGIYMPGPNGTQIADPGPGPYFPGFLISTNNTKDNARHILTNYYGSEIAKGMYEDLIATQAPVLGRIDEQEGVLFSVLFTPVFDQMKPPRSVVGAVQLDVVWQSHLQSAVSPQEGSIMAVLTNGAGDAVSFEVFEDNVIFLGKGDFHDPSFDEYVVSTEVSVPNLENSTNGNTNVSFSYTLSVYPTESFAAVFKTNLPMVYGVVTAIIFLFIIILFVIYDRLVERRQRHVAGEAVRFGQVVNALFPSVVRHRVLSRESTKGRRWDRRGILPRLNSVANRKTNDDAIRVAEPAKTRLRTFLNRDDNLNRTDMEQYQLDDPIADLFPETTIMFADISGFTAWSSEREPCQVFYLLETLYRAFDHLASKLGVFKVETIGDCYVAVTGLPDPNKDHALVMARFAHECLLKMNELVKSLEVSLGPGTSDLAIRVGLHSGPVTAGVLRGEKCRFQLFGDTMNTASRMESTGSRNKIHVSDDTANLLKQGGKGHWLTEREGRVNAKGKGEMKSWWLMPQRAPSTSSSTNNQAVNEVVHHLETKQRNSPHNARPVLKEAETWGNLDLESYGVDADKKARLVNWNVEIIGELLSKVVIWRSLRSKPNLKRGRSESSISVVDSLDSDEDETTVFDEVSEIIPFPTFSENSTLLGALVPDASRISDTVKAQLHHFISRIADCYHNVPFHNLEHASHVTLSANKLMKRIIAPAEADFTLGEGERRRMMRRRSFGDFQNSLESVERNLHISTFGISSDPLCQLAIVFSALIHDVDHSGVPNSQLVKENAPIAAKYHKRSVAEQNSVDIAWGILMDDRYEDLRDCIFENDTDRRRFRQLVVNSVMATDIVDKELKQLRDNRWATAFDESKSGSMSDIDVNRKATIVIEHIIQASDVAHTMQHWHIYSKWNEKLFCEMYTAYLAGRAATDPSEGWYGGEIWFFDNYIIPLAKKLKECGVFGVASDEYLGFALENREEWVIKGKAVVAKMLKAYKKRHGGQSQQSDPGVTSDNEQVEGKLLSGDHEQLESSGTAETLESDLPNASPDQEGILKA